MTHPWRFFLFGTGDGSLCYGVESIYIYLYFIFMWHFGVNSTALMRPELIL